MSMARTMSNLRHPAQSNTNQSGVRQGTPGGAATSKPGSRQLMLGDEMYLWVLVFLEVGLMAFLRKNFRRHHGG